MNNDSPVLCPCGSGSLLAQCCGPFIAFQRNPMTPEQLMRSRYSAYQLKNNKYLLQSWHVSTRPAVLNLENDTTNWIKLKIISASENKVEFVAFYKSNESKKDDIFALYEQSYFLNEGRWFYHHGEELKTVTVSQNRLCPCKSGKKFKRCCGQA